MNSAIMIVMINRVPRTSVGRVAKERRP